MEYQKKLNLSKENGNVSEIFLLQLSEYYFDEVLLLYTIFKIGTKRINVECTNFLRGGFEGEGVLSAKKIFHHGS